MASAPQTRRERSSRAIAQLVEQLSRVVAARAFVGGMNPAHWAALRYIAQANESARTIGAFAKFHMTTPSSASQTMTALENKGLVVKRPGADSRQRLLEITPKGRRLMADDPIDELAAVVSALDDDQMRLMAEIMEKLTRGIATPAKRDAASSND